MLAREIIMRQPAVIVLLVWLTGAALCGRTRGEFQGQEKLDAPTVELPPVLPTGKGFSFRLGKVIPLWQDEMAEFSLDVDLVWDPPTGLAANTVQNYRPFSGKGGIVDLGKRAFKEVKEAPLKGYARYLDVKEIRVGHTFCVLTADGKHYAKIEIIEHDPKRPKLVIRWQYQPKETNKFD
jgi:hypothetical protein